MPEDAHRIPAFATSKDLLGQGSIHKGMVL